jgi:hypothetical protein
MLTSSSPREAAMSAPICPSFVLAALDDDAGCAGVLAYAREQARQRGLPLRAAHVWTRHEAISDGYRLLTAALYDNLPPDEAAVVERQILHDDDPARALAALTRDAAVVVAAAGTLGETVQRLADLADCPVAIVPAAAPAASGW